MLDQIDTVSKFHVSQPWQSNCHNTETPVTITTPPIITIHKYLNIVVKDQEPVSIRPMQQNKHNKSVTYVEIQFQINSKQ